MRTKLVSAMIMSLAISQSVKAQTSESSSSVSKAYAQYERDRDAQRAHQELLDAIEKAKNEILELVLKLEEREIRACADASVIEFSSFLQSQQITKEILSGKYLTCITEAYRTINEEPYETAVRYASAFHVLNVTTMFMRKSLGFDVRPLAQMGLNVTNLTERNWQAKIGYLRQLDIGDDGEVWGVNDDEVVFRWTGASWVQPSPSARLSGITVGSRNNIWGVTRDGLVFRWNGSTWLQPDPAARLRQISAGPDGEVWGVSSSGGVFRWNGFSWTQPLATARLSHISVGSRDHIWGVGPDGAVFQWRNGTWIQPSPAARLKQVSVGPDGDVWGVNTGVFRWTGGAWYQPNPSARLAHIAVGKYGSVWGTTLNATIFSRELDQGTELFDFYRTRL